MSAPSTTTPTLRDRRERAFELHGRGDFASARTIYHEVLSRSPDDPEVKSALGVLALQTGEYAAAAGIFSVELAARESPDLNCYLGNALSGLGRVEEALERYDRAIAIKADFAAAQLNRAHALRHLRRHEEALAACDRAIDLSPQFVEALVARAEICCDLSRWTEAILDYDGAIAIRSDVELQLRRGSLLLKVGRPAESLACADRALARRRPFPAAWLARAAALEELGRAADAFAAVESALAEEPDHVKALVGRANLLYARGDFRAASADFKKATARDPTFGPARIGAVIAQIPVVPASVEESLGSRTAFREGLLQLSASLRSFPCTEPTSLVGMLQPYNLAYQEHDNRELLALYGSVCAELMEDWRRANGITCSPARAAGSSRIRIAIVSAHVRAHSVYNALTRGWLEHLDRRRFEVHVFHTGAQHDAETDHARSLADDFLEGTRSTLDWARAIEASRPDVLLYPEIGMDRVCVQLASQRLAPVQAVSWGHPETTGLPTIDYFLSADAFEPPDADAHYTERLMRLPNLGCCYERLPASRMTGPAPALPEGAGPHLVCAGMPFKYAPEHDRVLVEIARRLGRCRFHFFSAGDGALTRRLAARLGGAFSRAGLDPGRHLVLHPWASLDQFRFFLTTADLMLDTLGFSGFNTVLQALECQLPVVSHRGRFLRGRLGAGILERLSLQELVAETPDEYIERVETLLRDPETAPSLRGRIRESLPVLYGDRASLAGFERFLSEAVDAGMIQGARNKLADCS